MLIVKFNKKCDGSVIYQHEVNVIWLPVVSISSKYEEIENCSNMNES